MKKIFWLFLPFFAQAQSTDSVALWPNGVPGLKVHQIKEVNSVSGDFVRSGFVSEPKLYIYKPKEKKSNAAVVVCPGGGYSIVALKHEGHDIAQYLNTLGITAVVLKYRLPHADMFENPTIRPLQDAQAAIRYVKQHAKEWGIDATQVGIMGFSAGGHLAASTSSFAQKPIDASEVSAAPAFQILIYPVISFSDSFGHVGSRDNLLGKDAHQDAIEAYSNEKNVRPDTPPTFLLSTTDDFVSPKNAIAYYQACLRAKVPVELHVFEKGGHGYGLQKRGNPAVETWPALLELWLKSRKLI